MQNSLADFSARAEARFCGVGDKTEPFHLTCAPSVLGSAANDDSGSDEETRAPQAEPSLLPWSLVSAGELDGCGEPLAEPSDASRRAFEDEPDEDEFDVMATGSFWFHSEEGKPPRSTEVKKRCS